MKQKRTVACRRTGRPIFNRAAYVECYTFYTQWRLRWATWRDFINSNQTSLKPVSLVVPCFIFISRSLSLSLSFYNFARFHLLLFDRRKKRHERLIDFLNFPPLEWRERERKKKSFKVFAKGRKSRLQRFLFPSLSTPPLDDQRDTLPFGWTETKMQTFIRIQVCIEGQLSTDTLCIKSLVAVLAMGKRIFLNCLLRFIVHLYRREIWTSKNMHKFIRLIWARFRLIFHILISS